MKLSQLRESQPHQYRVAKGQLLRALAALDQALEVLAPTEVGKYVKTSAQSIEEVIRIYFHDYVVEEEDE